MFCRRVYETQRHNGWQRKNALVAFPTVARITRNSGIWGVASSHAHDVKCQKLRQHRDRGCCWVWDVEKKTNNKNTHHIRSRTALCNQCRTWRHRRDLYTCLWRNKALTLRRKTAPLRSPGGPVAKVKQCFCKITNTGKDSGNWFRKTIAHSESLFITTCIYLIFKRMNRTNKIQNMEATRRSKTWQKVRNYPQCSHGHHAYRANFKSLNTLDRQKGNLVLILSAEKGV